MTARKILFAAAISLSLVATAANPSSATTAEDSSSATPTNRPARITADVTHYDRPQGVVYFKGHVHVDDEQYQLHANEAYVFASGTNEIRRIVAIGNVAMTNELRRAYGGKVSYYRDSRMVILYADANTVAEIRDESNRDDQVVRGSKIRFWIDNQQVEVLDATVFAPAEGTPLDGLPNKRR